MTTATAPADTTGIKAEILAIAAGISKHITTNAKEGTVDVAEGAYGEALEAAGATLDMKAKVDKANSLVLPALTLAQGQAAKEVLQANPKLDMVTSEVSVGGRSTYATTMTRESTSRNPKTGEETVKLFNAKSVHTYAPAANGAEMKRVRDSLSEAAATAAAGK